MNSNLSGGKDGKPKIVANFVPQEALTKNILIVPSALQRSIEIPNDPIREDEKLIFQSMVSLVPAKAGLLTATRASNATSRAIKEGNTVRKHSSLAIYRWVRLFFFLANARRLLAALKYLVSSSRSARGCA